MIDEKIGATPDRPRRVHVLPTGAKMEDGKTYEGWHCKQCGYFMVIDQSWPEAARIPDAHYVEAICPHCKTARLGTWAGRETLQYRSVPGASPLPSRGGTPRK
jgi:hypothetical protein